MYNELTDAFLSGHVSLPDAPDRALLLLPDPYNPKANINLRRNDVSYFKGHYYLYHSPIPVLVLFLPVKIATGRYLAEDTAGEIFSIVGLAAALCCLLSLRNDYFPRTPLGLLFLCGCALGCCGGQFSVLREATVNHVAIACASAFLMLAFFAALRSLRSQRHALAWLSMATVCQAMAALSRPDFIFGSIGLIALIVPLLKNTASKTKGPVFLALAAGTLTLPMLVIGGLGALYNYERFGTPFEFGARLMLGGWDQRNLGFFSLGGAADNAWYYFFAPAHYHRYFPFVTAPTWRSIGIVPNFPFLIFSLLLLIPSLKRPAGFVAYASVVLIFNTLSLLLLPSGNEAAVTTSANLRYLPDIASTAVMLGCVGVMGYWERPKKWQLANHLVVGAVVLVTLWSILAGVSLDLQRFSTSSYRQLAQILNEPTALWESISGQRYGPLVLSVRFPNDLAGQSDPLVVTGEKDAADMIFVNYLGNSSISFGLASDGIVGPRGKAISVDEKVPNRIEVWMGSLYPPIGHPALKQMSYDEAIVAKRTVRVVLNDTVVLDDVILCHEANPSQTWIGSSEHYFPAFSDSFRGSILSFSRLKLRDAKPILHAPVFGSVRLVVRFPTGNMGAAEPLVVTGEPEAGDFVYTDYVAKDRIRFCVDHWGRPLIASQTIALNYALPHTIWISMDSLFPKHETPRGIAIDLDGRQILASDQASYDATPYEVAICRNPIGGSTCSYDFTGQLIQVTRGDAK